MKSSFVMYLECVQLCFFKKLLNVGGVSTSLHHSPTFNINQKFIEAQFESSLKGLHWKTLKVRDIFPSGVLQLKSESLFTAETNPADGRRVIFSLADVETDGCFLASQFQQQHLFYLALYNTLKALFKNLKALACANCISSRIIGTIHEQKQKQINKKFKTCNYYLILVLF